MCGVCVHVSMLLRTKRRVVESIEKEGGRGGKESTQREEGEQFVSSKQSPFSISSTSTELE